jgi:hypothetical protein
MVLLAFSLQSEIEKYGAYVGIAAFFGLAILSLLYFAQAREVKRLRDWAGRAPERAAELEALAIAHAEEARRAPAPAPAAEPATVPPVQRITAPAAPANGTVELEPAQVAALAFARAAGVRTPHPPRPHPAPVAAAPADAPPAEVAAAGAATATGDATAVADVAAGNGHGSGDVPAPATPAARRAEAAPPPRAAAPLRQAPPPRRPAAPRRAALAGPPARRESSARTIVLTALVGLAVLAAVVFAVVKLTGGGGSHAPAPQPKVVTQSSPASPSATATAQATPALTKATTRVEVYNGTTVSGLAGSVRDQLASLGYDQANLDAATYTPNQRRQASTVMYQRGDRSAAATVARSLGISDVRLIDTATQQLLQQSGKKWDVVVIVGADKSQ